MGRSRIQYNAIKNATKATNATNATMEKRYLKIINIVLSCKTAAQFKNACIYVDSFKQQRRSFPGGPLSHMDGILVGVILGKISQFNVIKEERDELLKSWY